MVRRSGRILANFIFLQTITVWMNIGLVTHMLKESSKCTTKFNEILLGHQLFILIQISEISLPGFGNTILLRSLKAVLTH